MPISRPFLCTSTTSTHPPQQACRLPHHVWPLSGACESTCKSPNCHARLSAATLDHDCPGTAGACCAVAEGPHCSGSGAQGTPLAFLRLRRILLQHMVCPDRLTSCFWTILDQAPLLTRLSLVCACCCPGHALPVSTPEPCYDLTCP